MYRKVIAIVLAAVSLTACGNNVKTTDTPKLPAANETIKNQEIENTANTSDSDSVETTNDEIKQQPLLEQRLYAEEKQKGNMPEKMPDTLELVINKLSGFVGENPRACPGDEALFFWLTLA